MDFFLRELSREDVPTINTWRNDSALIGMLGAAFRYVSEAVDHKWFEGYLANRANAVRLAICEQKTTALIGAVYLLDIDWVHRSAEFGLWIGDKASQGQGAGRFATCAMLAHAFQDLNLHRVHLTVHVHNEHAIALYEKSGFLTEGTLRQALFKNGQFIDMRCMAVLAEDYRRALLVTSEAVYNLASKRSAKTK